MLHSAFATTRSARYRFEHGRDETPHVVCVGFDDPYRLPCSTHGSVRFHRADATEAEDSLSAWDAQRSLGPAEAALGSYDHRQAGASGAAEGAAVEQGADGKRAEASLQDYDAPGLYYGRDGDELAGYARLRQQAHDRMKKRFSGEGTVRALEAGHRFALTGHPVHDSDPSEKREFVVTGLRFTTHNNLPDPLSRALGRTAPAPYRASFDAQRRGLPLVPEFARTPHARPTAWGPQTATVVGPADEEIHTEVLGRVKVQFHWQRPAEHPSFGANYDERSSCLLRVAYPSAGAQWGHQFIPRIGQEVLVDFLEGDIDRPLVVAVVHNGSHPPPTFSGAGSLPANRALSGIKSKEYQGTGYNELLFDDSTGELHDDGEIPEEPGYCFAGGFIADDEWMNEEAGVDIDLPDQPDVVLSIHIFPLALHKHDTPLLDRVGGVLQGLGNLASGVQVLRKGERQVGPYKGQEYLVSTPGSGGSRAHSFIWETQGESTLDTPFISIEFSSGRPDGNGNPQPTRLTNAQALQLWDRIVGSFRLRPTGGAATTSNAQPPETPRGTELVTGRSCPQTRWWECDEAGVVPEDRRRFINEGDSMPKATFFSSAGLWDKLRGMQRAHRAAAVWKLVAYDEAPRDEVARDEGGALSSPGESSPNAGGDLQRLGADRIA